MMLELEKIAFEDLPSTNTPINAKNLNKVQDNVETALNNVTLNAEEIIYDNSETEIESENVQDAIKEIANKTEVTNSWSEEKTTEKSLSFVANLATL